MTTLDRSLFITAADGLRLHAREYGERASPGLPVVCLPGLTRTAADFDALAAALAAESARRVLALDSRGRGLSGYDRDPAHYSLPVELADLIVVLEQCAVGPAVFVGTSRGGLLTMLLATVRPKALAGAVLNDIGPVIETAGLIRIKSYVGKLPQPRDMAEGAEIVRDLFGSQFTKLTDDEWRAFAERTWRIEGERLVPTYDVGLEKALAEFDPGRPLQDMWPQFDAMAGVPLLVVRGANSDILSPATLAAMRERHPGLESFEVADQGHAPLLVDAPTVGRIATFVAECEKKAVPEEPRTASGRPPSES
jgi:pimeloyl-ACP methyl ester carboxylesterase